MANYTLRWDQALPAAKRFVVLAAFNNEAVLDKNTGLVWERAPSEFGLDWFSAKDLCLNKNVGGTVGWRLPSVAELSSVRDPALSAPFVPASAFTNVLKNTYWSATETVWVTGSSDHAWLVYFGDEVDLTRVGHGPKDIQHGVWCVRGGMNADRY